MPSDSNRKVQEKRRGRGPRVAIVGGGLSGTLLCLRVLRDLPAAQITLFERTPRQLNRGVAYSARLSRQLLNVPAGRMGLFPEDVGGFLQWARTGPLPQAGPADFLPRSLFGDYVHDVFHGELEKHSGRVRIQSGEVVSLDHSSAHGHRLRLADGSWSDHDSVVLALGNAPPAHVPNLSTAAQHAPGYVGSPWLPGAMARVGADDAVLFVGAGLTMVDLLLTLEEHGYRGAVTVLSRHGLLPRAHAPATPWSVLPPPMIDTSVEVAALVRWVRMEVERARLSAVPWQSVLDGVKAHVASLWRAMPAPERERFMRHVRPYWEVHRHRMPRPAHDHLQVLLGQGRLRTLAARVERIDLDGEDLVVNYRSRGSGAPGSLRTAWVINCSGPQADTRRLEQPLLLDLLNKGMASCDTLNLGLRTAEDGALLDVYGKRTPRLYALGPPCKASQWECTSVPDIREQTVTLVRALEAENTAGTKGFRRMLNELLDHLALPAS